MKNFFPAQDPFYRSPNGVFQIIISCALFLTGCACVLFTDHVFRILPYVLGSLLLLLGILRLYQVIQDKKYDENETFAAGNGGLYLILGTIILIKNINAYYMIGIVWGMFGLIRDSRNFASEIAKLINRKEKIKDLAFELAYSLFGVAVSTLLLFDPPEHLRFHIALLGLELFDSAFRVLRDGIYFRREELF